MAAAGVVAATGGMATVAGAASTEGAAAEVATSVDDGARSDDAISPERHAPGARTAEQTVRLEVRGGSLSIQPTTASVQLVRDGDVLRGELDDATVIDARGTLDGWRARARVVEITGVDADGATQRIPPGRVTVTPTSPTADAGRIDEVSGGRPFRAKANGTLMRSETGGGGGTFVGGATIEAAEAGDLTGAIVTLRFSVR